MKPLTREKVAQSMMGTHGLMGTVVPSTLVYCGWRHLHFRLEDLLCETLMCSWRHRDTFFFFLSPKYCKSWQRHHIPAVSVISAPRFTLKSLKFRGEMPGFMCSSADKYCEKTLRVEKTDSGRHLESQRDQFGIWRDWKRTRFRNAVSWCHAATLCNPMFRLKMKNPQKGFCSLEIMFQPRANRGIHAGPRVRRSVKVCHGFLCLISFIPEGALNIQLGKRSESKG